MAEISALTLELNLKSEGLESGLKEIKNKFLGVLGSIDSSGSKVGSTFEGITDQLQSLGKELSNAGRGVSTLENSAGSGLATSFNQANGSLSNLQQTIANIQSINIEISISGITGSTESVNSLKDAFDEFENQIGNSGIANFIQDIAKDINELNKTHPEIVQTSAIVLGLGFVFFQLGLAVAAAAAVVGSEFIVTLGVVSVAIAGIIAGVVSLIQNWDALVLAAQVTWEENIVPIIESAANAIGGIIGAVGQFIQDTFNTAINFISEKWTSFINFISENVPFVGKLIEGLTPDPDAAQNHPFFKALKNNPDLNKGGLLGLKDIKLTPQQLEAAKMWAGVNREIEQSAKGASEAMGNMSSGVKEAGDQTEKVGIKVKITSGNLSTFDSNAGGVLNTVDQLTGGLNKQIPKLDLQREALDKNGDELKELEEKARKAEEALKKFEDLQFSLLPESDQERIRLQETLDFLDEFAKKRADLEQEIASVRVQVTEEANEKIRDLERKEYIQRLKDSGGFIDGIKAGFLEFADSVENNSELISQFFADTLSQMSQNFSDLFFNVLTGKFDDLADLAKQAFEAILRAFLDLVSAIVTKQIVISIAGVFGIGKDAGGGGLDFAKQVFGIFEDAGSFFGTGSAAAGAGAVVAGAGGGVIASGSGLGGFAASGLSSVGTASFGATSVFDVAAAGGEGEYKLAA